MGIQGTELQTGLPGKETPAAGEHLPGLVQRPVEQAATWERAHKPFGHVGSRLSFWVLWTARHTFSHVLVLQTALGVKQEPQ